MLRLGCVPDLPLQRLHGLLGPLGARDGGADAEIVHRRSPELLSRLLEGELDAAVIQLRRSVAGIEMEPLFEGERLCAFVQIGGRLVEASPLAAGDFETATLLVAPRAIDPPLHDRLMGALDASGFRFRAMREVGGGDPRDVLFAVAEGRGVAIAASSIPEVIGGTGAIVARCDIEPALLGPETLIAWRADSAARAGELIDAARALQRT